MGVLKTKSPTIGVCSRAPDFWSSHVELRARVAEAERLHRASLLRVAWSVFGGGYHLVVCCLGMAWIENPYTAQTQCGKAEQHLHMAGLSGLGAPKPCRAPIYLQDSFAFCFKTSGLQIHARYGLWARGCLDRGA